MGVWGLRECIMRNCFLIAFSEPSQKSVGVLPVLSGRTRFIVKRYMVNRLQGFLWQPCLQFTRLEVSVESPGVLDTLPPLWEAVSSIRVGAERCRRLKCCFLRLLLSGDGYAGGDESSQTSTGKWGAVEERLRAENILHKPYSFIKLKRPVGDLKHGKHQTVCN